MAYSFRGSISFGLVYIPITLHSCIKRHDVSFNMLDAKTGSRVVYKKTCVECGGREITQQDIVRGFQYQKNRYVTLSDKELEGLKSKKDKSVTIDTFCSLEEIDPIYFDTTYFAVPESGAEKAFFLLLAALDKQNKVGIAKTMLGGRECLAAVRVKDGQMLLSSMYFADELKQNPAKEMPDMKSADKELDMAASIINSMSKGFDIASYHDEYKARLMGAIEQKIAGQKIDEPEKSENIKVGSLMDALSKSLEKLKAAQEQNKEKPAKKSKSK